jgi:hypothetical protein
MRCAIAILALSLAACFPPSVVPAYSSGTFRLPDLRAERVAVWPIPGATLDESTSETVRTEYGSGDAFLKTMSIRFSEAVARVCRGPSLDSGQVRSALSGTRATQALLDPGVMLGERVSEGIPGASDAALTTLSAVEGLRGVRYAVVVRHMGLARLVNAGFGGGATFPSSAGSAGAGHAGPVTVVGATIIGGMPVGGTVVGGTAVGGTVLGGGGFSGGTVVGGTAIGGVRMGGATVGAMVVGGTQVGGIGAGAPALGGGSGGGGGLDIRTFGRLDLTVVDLETREVVWEGSVHADSSSAFLTGTALHEVEDDLIQNLVYEVMPEIRRASGR